MKTPEQIADEIPLPRVISSGQTLKQLMVQAIQVDRAQRGPDEEDHPAPEELGPDSFGGPYQVTWVISADEGQTPAEAAAHIWAQIFGRSAPGPDDACIFEVLEPGTGCKVTIDLSEPQYTDLFER